ncbi:hypothetical protein ACHAPJ_013631, partial [Fusarium lateritium]
INSQKQRDVGVSTSSLEEAFLFADHRMRRPVKARLANLPVTSHPARPLWMTSRTRRLHSQMSRANAEEVSQAPAVAGVIQQPMALPHLFLAAHRSDRNPEASQAAPLQKARPKRNWISLLTVTSRLPHRP